MNLHPNIILAIIMCIFLAICPVCLYHYRTDIKDKQFSMLIACVWIIASIGILILVFHVYG